MTKPLTRASSPLMLVGLIGLLIFVFLYKKANPQASVTLEITRQEALTRAREFIEQRGADLSGAKEAVQFRGANLGLVFLQRTVGLDDASRWAREEVPIWSWNVRWFTPDEKEEWRVNVGTDGKIVGFTHLIDEAAAGADLAEEEAQEIAESFAHEQGWDLDDFNPVEAASEQQDNRTDHKFVWEKIGVSIPWAEEGADTASASVRLEVKVQGDEIGAYRHFLEVPEAFRRDLQQTQSVGTVLSLVSTALSFVLALIALGIVISRHKSSDVRWRPAFTLAIVVATLLVLQGVLSWPEAMFGYPTEIQWMAYMGILAVVLLLFGVFYGVFVLFATAAGETLGRQTYPESLRGFVSLASGKFREHSLAVSCLNGYSLGFVLLGYLVVFYVIAQRYLGAWLPAEGPYSEIFNLYWPFLAPLTISLVAAISEEVVYRLFGISLLKKYLKSTIVALLVPAIIWAFAHASYPVFPVYIRGIELTIGGLIFGVAFLRLGLVTCIVAHFVLDAVLLGMPLLTSGNTTYLVSGVLVIGIGLLPGLLALVGRTDGTKASAAHT